MESIPYDKRSGKIWFNGKTVEWGDANIHILNPVSYTHLTLPTMELV